MHDAPDTRQHPDAQYPAPNFQHAPANIGFFALADLAGGHPGWSGVIVWSIVPAGIGNLLGGTLFVALPLWHALGRGVATRAVR